MNMITGALLWAVLSAIGLVLEAIGRVIVGAYSERGIS